MRTRKEIQEDIDANEYIKGADKLILELLLDIRAGIC